MKQRFQILNDPRFHLVYGETARFVEAPTPSRVRLNREGFTLVAGLKKKAKVYAGMLLAEHPAPTKGDLFASISGVITDITERSIFITASDDFDPEKNPEAAQEVAEALKPVDLLAEGLEGDALRMALKKLGVNTRSLGRKCTTLIINALNPDPGVTWAEPMLGIHVKHLRVGMELHRRMMQAKEVIVALPEGCTIKYDGVKIAHVPASYPNSLDKLVAKAVMGEENPVDVGVVGLHNIWSLGRVGLLGLPLIESVITVANASTSANYIVRDGSTIGEVLASADITPKEADLVVRGGPLRGESVDDLSRSTTKGTYGLFVVEHGTLPPMKGHSQCVNCGACELVCPARINPSALSRYAEFALHDRCRAEYIDACFECGLCGYVCPARRPVLQYIRLSKQKLAEVPGTPLEL